MNILVIGGTRFLGRAIVEAALAAGHDVTLFNRGKTNPGLFPNVQEVHGDRANADDYAPLTGRTWDAVIDTCGYTPNAVDLATKTLDTGHYTFISTISVYDESVNVMHHADEELALKELPADASHDEVTNETYGALKVLCEQAAEANLPGKVLQVRSGLIVGPHDPTDRFTYWPVRLSRGGTMLAPLAESPLQVIDARDQAAWIIRMAETQKPGVYNVTGPTITFGEVLAASRAAVGEGAAAVVHADDDFLLEQEVRPWTDLPLWLPKSQDGLAYVSIEKALADGLAVRPLQDIVADTLQWYPKGQDLKAGLSAEREAELLAARSG